MKVKPLFLCDAGLSFLPYPLDSDTVQLYQDYWCSIQSQVLNTLAVPNGGYSGCI